MFETAFKDFGVGCHFWIPTQSAKAFCCRKRRDCCQYSKCQDANLSQLFGFDLRSRSDLFFSVHKKSLKLLTELIMRQFRDN